MSSHSVASALRNTTHDTILISGNKPADNDDVIIRFYSAKVHSYMFMLSIT